LFELSANVQRGSRVDGGITGVSLPAEKFGFGGFIPTREILMTIGDVKELAQQDDVTQQATSEGHEDDETSFKIEGPASRREVIYKPSRLPEVTIDMEVDIHLKFWILPDGTVGEVVPLQRGDIQLERAAIQYLRSWRFTLSPDGREVWGIMPIKYKLR
jgi:TonB family protein